MTRRLAAALTALVLAGAAAGCSSGRSDLGTSNGPCYVALPTAAAAVGGQGRLVGVHRAPLSALRRTGTIFNSVTAGGPRSGQVCLVAWAGQFRANQVQRPAGRATGKLAVVVVTYPGNQLLGTVILRHFPIEFGHARLGPF